MNLLVLLAPLASIVQAVLHEGRVAGRSPAARSGVTLAAGSVEHLTLRDGSIDVQLRPFVVPDFEEKPARIPRVLHFTGKETQFKDVHRMIQQNVRRELEQNPTLTAKFWGDSACRAYLKRFYPKPLLERFDHAKRGKYSGAYRGDICRAAVLYREGGYYMDMDLQLRVPLADFIDRRASFMGVRDSNMLMAAVPEHPILRETINQISIWYRRYDEGKEEELMGPITVARGFKKVCTCGMNCFKDALIYKCGGHVVQLYKEAMETCLHTNDGCPIERRSTALTLLLQGKNPFHLFFTIRGPKPKREVIGWSRFKDCLALGCGGTGYEDKDVETMMREGDAAGAPAGAPSGAVPHNSGLVQVQLGAPLRGLVK